MNVHSYKSLKYSEYDCAAGDNNICDTKITYQRVYDKIYVLCYVSLYSGQFFVSLDLFKKTTCINPNNTKFFSDKIEIRKCELKKWLVSNKEIDDLAHTYIVFS